MTPNLKPLVLAALLGLAGASHAEIGAPAAPADDTAAWFDSQALAAAGQRMATAVAVPNDVPEPGTLALAALGLGVAGLSARRRR